MFSKKKSIYEISKYRKYPSIFDQESQTQDQQHNEFLSLKQKTQQFSQFRQDDDHFMADSANNLLLQEEINETQSSQSPCYSPLTNNDYRYRSQTQNGSNLLQSYLSPYQTSESPNYSPLTRNDYRYSSKSSSTKEVRAFLQSKIDATDSKHSRTQSQFNLQSQVYSNLHSFEDNLPSPIDQSSNFSYQDQNNLLSNYSQQHDDGNRDVENSYYEIQWTTQQQSQENLFSSQYAADEGKSQSQQIQSQQNSLDNSSGIHSEYLQTSMITDDGDYFEEFADRETFDHESATKKQDPLPELNIETNCGSIPQYIIECYRNIREKHCDWAFVTFLAKQLAADIAPPSSFMSLKISLLLSLVSIRENPIHVLAVGKEISIISRIMHSIGGFARRFVIGYQGASTKSANSGIETSSSMDLAKSGVNLIREISQLSPAVVSKIMEEITDRRSCAIWSFFNNSENVKKENLDNYYNIAATFGFPVAADDENSFEEIMEFILNSVNQKVNIGIEIPSCDMLKFISCVSQISVQFSSEAYETLEKYFEANKIVREDTLDTGGLEMIKKLAVSHAKLCMKNCVEKIDVLAGIYICENTMSTFCDIDCSFPTSLSSKSYESFNEIDMFVLRLNEWLDHFIENNSA